ncbi:MAG: DUF5671 domain-containing protein, partial [Caulobacterales bacterium]|nr:DUF5671 domain-containing protein [Caulobacterales bacterium]
MADKTLIDFVRAALSAGSERAAIAAALKDAGWPESQIGDAMATFAEVDFPTPVPRPRTSTSARETFIYLLTFILLTIAALHFGALGFVLVNLAFPDPSASLRSFAAAEGAIRWSVSALTIAWPLFLFVTFRSARARRLNPRMQRSGVRRWLTYLALVVTASVLVGDLITVVFNFLSGDLTMRLFAKALIVAAIAGAIFVHYVRDAEREGAAEAKRAVIGPAIAGVATVAIVGAGVAGMLMIDSPATARERRADDAKLALAAAVAGAIDCHWTVTAGALPVSLDALKIRYDQGMTIPGDEPLPCYVPALAEDDPLTVLSYERGAGASYQICAEFERSSD